MIEIILVSSVALDATIQLIGAGKGADLIRMHGEGLAAAGHLAFAAANSNDGGIARFIYSDFVGARPENGKRQVGRIYFKGFIFAEALHANSQSSFRQTKLD